MKNTNENELNALVEEPKEMPVEMPGDLKSLMQTLNEDDLRDLTKNVSDIYDDAFRDTRDYALKDARERGLAESEASKESIDKAHDFAKQEAIAAAVGWFTCKGMLSPEE